MKKLSSYLQIFRSHLYHQFFTDKLFEFLSLDQFLCADKQNEGAVGAAEHTVDLVDADVAVLRRLLGGQRHFQVDGYGEDVVHGKDKPGFKAKHEAELVIFEAARSTLLAMQDDEKLPSLKTLQAEQQRLLEEQQRLYDERAKLKKEARLIDTMKANVDIFLKPSVVQEPEQIRDNQRE